MTRIFFFTWSKISIFWILLSLYLQKKQQFIFFPSSSCCGWIRDGTNLQHYWTVLYIVQVILLEDFHLLLLMVRNCRRFCIRTEHFVKVGYKYETNHFGCQINTSLLILWLKRRSKLTSFCRTKWMLRHSWGPGRLQHTSGWDCCTPPAHIDYG